jgi:hypothetical protein
MHKQENNTAFSKKGNYSFLSGQVLEPGVEEEDGEESSSTLTSSQEEEEEEYQGLDTSRLTLNGDYYNISLVEEPAKNQDLPPPEDHSSIARDVHIDEDDKKKAETKPEADDEGHLLEKESIDTEFSPRMSGEDARNEAERETTVIPIATSSPATSSPATSSPVSSDKALNLTRGEDKTGVQWHENSGYEEERAGDKNPEAEKKEDSEIERRLNLNGFPDLGITEDDAVLSLESAAILEKNVTPRATKEEKRNGAAVGKEMGYSNGASRGQNSVLAAGTCCMVVHLTC